MDLADQLVAITRLPLGRLLMVALTCLALLLALAISEARRAQRRADMHRRAWRAACGVDLPAAPDGAAVIDLAAARRAASNRGTAA